MGDTSRRDNRDSVRIDYWYFCVNRTMVDTIANVRRRRGTVRSWLPDPFRAGYFLFGGERNAITF